MKTLYKLLIFSLFYNISLHAQNTGLLFDGTSESVTVPYKSSLDVDSDHTFEAWIFANEWKSLSWQGSIFANDGQGPDGGFAFRCGDNGKLSLVISIDNVWNEIISPSIMNTKQWHHVAGVVDNGSMRLYIDGQEVASGTYSGNHVNKTTPFTIGESTGFPGRVFDGILDEIRVWSTVRTPTELAEFKTEDLTGTEDGLVAYFPMNDGAGTTVTNLVDASCSGTTLEMDDSNWVDGYKLPDFDVSVKNISGIDRWHMKNRPVKMNVDIQNVGTMPMSNFDITVSVDGQQSANESIAQELDAGESLKYTVNTPIDLSSSSNPTIEVRITHPDDANALNNDASATIATRSGNVVNVFDNDQHNFGSAGQSQTNRIVLPGDLSNFEQLLLHISVSCPSGGCDPWDQTGSISVATDQGEFEIARYITPYGIACGPWKVDVTDFKSILAGEALYNSFVQVFGQSGWLVNIDLEMIEGQSAMEHSKVSPIHQKDYHVYGDPGIEDDLDPVLITVAENTEESHIRMHITGHGQGNTNNAAEFYQVTHEVMVNGSKLSDHLLWKSDCAANSCDDQAGNWLFPRAGWCPGQEVRPAIFNTTGTISAGETATLDYELANYTNLLNTGYNSSGHTEPHYRIHSVLVENSSERFSDYTNAIAEGFQFTTGAGSWAFSYFNDGTVDLTDYTVQIFINGELVFDEVQTETLSAGSGNGIDLSTDLFSEETNMIYGIISANGDETPGDNIYGELINFNPNSIEDMAVAAAFNISPNPTDNDINIQFEKELLGGQMALYGIDGRLIQTQSVQNLNEVISVNRAGTYFIKVVNREGHTAGKKVIVID